MALHIEMYWYWDQNPSTVWLRVHLCPGYRWLDTPPEGLSARPLLCKQLHPLNLACRRLSNSAQQILWFTVSVRVTDPGLDLVVITGSG